MVNGATTSGSKYARSELREMKGSERAAWKLSEGGTMTATLEVDKVPQKVRWQPGSGGRWPDPWPGRGACPSLL
ncbi:polysaccharide lyase family 7 protein [Azotobacter vinelandii]